MKSASGMRPPDEAHGTGEETIRPQQSSEAWGSSERLHLWTSPTSKIQHVSYVLDIMFSEFVQYVGHHMLNSCRMCWTSVFQHLSNLLRIIFPTCFQCVWHQCSNTCPMCWIYNFQHLSNALRIIGPA